MNTTQRRDLEAMLHSIIATGHMTGCVDRGYKAMCWKCEARIIADYIEAEWAF